MIGRLWLLACGQVRVRVTGASLTRFSTCARRRVSLCGGWTARHGMSCTQPIHPGFRNSGGTWAARDATHILRKRGLPFLAARLRPRTALWGGAVFAAALCWLLGTHVWAIADRDRTDVGRRRLSCGS